MSIRVTIALGAVPFIDFYAISHAFLTFAADFKL